MKNEITGVVLQTVVEYNKSVDEADKILTEMDVDLYGGDSNLDSLGLVSFIVGLEQNIEDKFNKSVSLANEKAMSQNSSPFKNLSSLVEFIQNELN